MTRCENALYHNATGGSSLRTRERHQLCPDTVAALAAAKNGATWRGVAQALGYPPAYAATLNKAARGIPGALTSVAEDTLRVRLGLAPVRRIEVDACPDCGSAHTGRCHGRPVVSVVILGPGERVARKTTQVMRRWADLPPRELARAIMNRVPYTAGATP